MHFIMHMAIEFECSLCSAIIYLDVYVCVFFCPLMRYRQFCLSFTQLKLWQEPCYDNQLLKIAPVVQPRNAVSLQ